MEMVKLRPLTESKPLTDYDKTYNWLRPRHVTLNLWQSTVRERLGKYVKYKALSFLFWCIFSRTRLLRWPVGAFSRMMAQITHSHARKCLFRGQHGGRQHLGGQISLKTVKRGLLTRFQRVNRTKQNDVIEELRHWLLRSGQSRPRHRAALTFAERGKPEVLYRPLNLDINSSIPEKQVTEMDAGRFSNNYSKQKQTIFMQSSNLRFCYS